MKSDSLFRGRYLFHFHTRQTDGELALADYFAWAQAHKVESLLFLEHVRRQATYDVAAFVEQIAELEVHTGIKTHVGFEAKLLPDGTLDISHEHLQLAKIVGIAEHGFADDLALLQSAFQRVIKVVPAQFPDCRFVWVHPGLWFKKRQIDRPSSKPYRSMLESAQESGILVERNLRYRLVDETLLPAISPELLVLGADAHTAADLDTWAASN